MSILLAIAAADALREELLAEIDRARDERVLLRSFDAGKIHARLAGREAFMQRMDGLQRRLLDAAGPMKTPESVPVELRGRIAEVKALAATLSELTSLNHQLARRAADCARAYVQALSPRAAAYDRRGTIAAGGPVLSVTRRA
jgi:hypothetical protein